MAALVPVVGGAVASKVIDDPGAAVRWVEGAGKTIGGWLGLEKGGQVGKGKKPGKPQLIVAHAGEVVLTKGQQAALLKSKTATGAKSVLRRVKAKKPTKPKKGDVKKALMPVLRAAAKAKKAKVARRKK